MNDSSRLPRLICSDGREFSVAGTMTIGRQSECQIQVQDGLVSRRHAALEVSDQKVVITDLDSNNGTWVNDQRITSPRELRDGDRVRIGDTNFVLKFPAPETQRTTHYSDAKEEDSATNRTMAWQSATLMTLVRGNDSAEFGLNRNTRIGRDDANDLPLKGDASASQFHAMIELVEGQALISDLNSNNGTWVNGKRITGKTILKHGDKIRVGNTVLRLRIGERALPPLDPTGVTPKAKAKSTWTGWVWVAVLLVGAILVMVCMVTVPAIFIFTSRDSATAQPVNTPGAAASGFTEEKQQALRALTLIVVPDQDVKNNDLFYSGSGSFINQDGYILTNFHVIGYTVREADAAGKNVGDLTNNLYKGEELILAGVNFSNPVAEPDTFYRCEIVKTDPNLDLALLRVAELYNNAADTFEPLPANLSFPIISVGNSDDLKILEGITIIGFPGVGGNTPTAIDDQVAGFSPDTDYNIENGWIKTGPVIGHGNSGGMAVNQKGELIGVPTMIVTNETDKIGYIRPINLALPLIQDFLP